MLPTPLLAVVIITNGKSDVLSDTFKSWIAENFSPGYTLFICGPSGVIKKNDIPISAIIEYSDPPFYLSNFHINHKKSHACKYIDSTYVYIVHDRFRPLEGFSSALSKALLEHDPDYGSSNVYNPDGSVALAELRLKKNVLGIPLQDALESVGRLTCCFGEDDASEAVAINGGQFFLRKSLVSLLDRPLRWVEMEDDVLSHDLRNSSGFWLQTTGLVTLVPRLAPNQKISIDVKIKYGSYRIICNIIAFITNSHSVGSKITHDELIAITNSGCFLIDPLHKITSSEFLPGSLEKIMARARIVSNGSCWHNIEKKWWGWKLYGEVSK